MYKEYYGGNTSVADFLRPEVQRYIPLVELPAHLNPFLEKYDIHIDAKLMNLLPLGNVKSLPAWQMLAGTPNVKGKVIVEASSGNTVTSLGVLSQFFGATGVHAIASPEVGDGKLALLQLAGVTVELVEGPICPNPNDPEGAIHKARQYGKHPNKINLDQYANPLNPEAHAAITGPQLYDQLGDDIGMFCAGLGTTGTMIGTASYLRKKIPSLKIGGIIRKPNNAVPGVRTQKGLKEVDFEWQDALNQAPVTIGEKESYAQSLNLIRAGLMVGPSSGFALAGTLAHLRQLEQSGAIEDLRGKHVVFVCPDGPLPYINNYIDILDASYFPPIINEHLRRKSTAIPQKSTPEITADELIKTKESYLLVDVREPEEFEGHHIERSVNVPLDHIAHWLKINTIDKPVVFICRSGRRSQSAVQSTIASGADAYNLRGGLVEWSDQGLPRIMPRTCQ